MVAGRGMMFVPIEEMFPKSRAACWLRGFSSLDYYSYAAMEWNGSNHHDVMKDLMDCGYMHSAVDDPHASFFGVVSRNEMNVIKRILGNNVVKGHLQDVANDIDGTPRLIMQDGTKLNIPGLDSSNNSESVEDIFIVNCTRLLFPRNPERPLMSSNGMMLSPQTALGLPGPTSSCLTHLWFTGKLQVVERSLYRVQYPSTAEEKEAFFCRTGLTVMNNLLVLTDEMPAHVLRRDCMNPQKWVPWNRQMMDFVKAKMIQRKIKEKCDRLLGPDMKYSELA